MTFKILANHKRVQKYSNLVRSSSVYAKQAETKMEINNDLEKKRTRRPNFLPDELKALVNGVSKRKNIINGAFTSTITGAAKQKAWDSVCQEVNACGICKRTVPELKQKFKTYKSEAKKEVATYRKQLGQTGLGGPPPKRPSALNEQVVSIIGDSMMQGIDGGIEVGGQEGQQITYQQIQHTPIDIDVVDVDDTIEEILFTEPLIIETANKACQTVQQGLSASGSILQQGAEMLAEMKRIGDLLEKNLRGQAESNALSVENIKMVAATLAAVATLLNRNQ